MSASDADKPPNDVFRFEIQEKSPFGIDSQGNLRSALSFDRETQGLLQTTVYACPLHSSRDKCASAKILVTIEDENDNTPVISHPSVYNNYTIYISNELSSDSNVTRIVATDLDSSSVITYYASDSKYFRLNPISGIVTTTRSIKTTEGSHYEFPVSITDGGRAPKSVNVTIFFIFNSSAKAFFDPLNHDKVILDQNNGMFIIIFVAVSSTVFSAILVVAILFLAKSHHSREDRVAKKEVKMKSNRNNSLKRQKQNTRSEEQLPSRGCCLYANHDRQVSHTLA